MSKIFTLKRKIEFADTDMAGLVHFTQYTYWMAATEEAFLDSLGIPSIQQKGTSWFGWPRTRIHCDYKAPLRFPGEVDIELTIADMSSRSIHFDFKFFNPNKERTLVAKGQMVTIYIEKQEQNNSLASTAIPEEYAKKLHSYIQ